MENRNKKLQYKASFSLEEPFQQLLDELYQYNADVETRVLHRMRLNLFDRLISQLKKRNLIKHYNSAVDIGCNAGMYSKIIYDSGFKHVLGIDIEPAYIKKALHFFSEIEGEKNLTFQVLDAGNLDTFIEQADFILCTEVIEHTDRPEKVIESIKQILSPGGIAVVTLPNRISLPYFFKMCIHKITGKAYDRETFDHLQYPFYKSLSLFKDSRLEIIKKTGTNLFYNGKILKLLKPITPLFTLMTGINYYLSRLWPFYYFTQFFFIVIRKKG